MMQSNRDCSTCVLPTLLGQLPPPVLLPFWGQVCTHATPTAVCTVVWVCVYVTENIQHYTGWRKGAGSCTGLLDSSSKHRQLEEKPSPSSTLFQHSTLLSSLPSPCLSYAPPSISFSLPPSTSALFCLFLLSGLSCSDTTTAGEGWEMGQRSHL